MKIQAHAGSTAVLVGAALCVMSLFGSAQQPLPPVEVPLPAILKDYAPITADRLKRPEPANWLQIRGTYDGWGYSPLDQINQKNVGQLQLAWVFSTGATAAHEAAPVVNNGVMYVSAPGNQVIAIDAKTGTQLWRYRRELPPGSIVMHPVSRGVALYGDKVYFASNAAVLVALNARTGAEVWTATVEDNKKGYYLSAAPIVADGKVMVGVSGGEFGIRGFVAAYDVETGKEAWRAFTIPGPGEPGHETWPAGGEEWKTGGGPTWVTGNYDPATNLLYWGVGNGGPWMGDLRPGDNLYVASTIAIDASTGKIVGHFQYNPNESFDWDEVSPPLLIDYARNGRTVTGLVNVARNGYIFNLERTKGPIRFVDAQPYVLQTAFKGVDSKTGRVEYDPERKPAVGKTVEFCPMYLGAKNWQPAAFNPKTRLIYIPTSANLCTRMTGLEPEYVPGRTFTGGRNELLIAPGADHIGETAAWNVDTGKKVWSHDFANSTNWGGILTTAGGLVFGGGTADRMFRALDASTGKLLWQIPTNSGVMGQPATFMVEGRQYVAVLSGWGGDARGVQARLNRLRPGEFPEVPDGGVIWVFALPASR
jgi:alcohol dehydrogenase (cytochrome c)